MPKTNNVAEGWHNAFATMTGIQRPTIFKFIDNLLKDEDLMRKKIISCMTGLPAPPPVAKNRQQNEAIKTVLQRYLKDMAKKADEEEDEEVYEEHDEGEEDRGHEVDDRTKWNKSPAKTVLEAVTAHSRMD